MEHTTAKGPIFQTAHRRGGAMSHHRHDHSFVTIVAHGSYIELQGHVPRRCASGESVIVHGPAEEHADYFLDDVLCLNVEVPRVCESRVLNVDVALRKVIEQVANSFYRNPPELPDSISELHALVCERLVFAPAPPPGWLQHVLDTFTWCDAVPLKDAAKAAGVHPVQFSRAFRVHVGASPSEFRLRSRLERASELLLATSLSLARVAGDCGFADQSHLTRTFNEALGLSPARYQRAFAR